MKLSTRFRFGVRIMLQVAMTEKNGPVLARHLARDQAITPAYADQILFALRTGNLLVSQRGRTGGFHLARPAREITVLDIYEALEGPISLVDCIDKADACERTGGCVTREVWSALSKALRSTLQGYTLAKLCEMQQGQQVGDYSI